MIRYGVSPKKRLHFLRGMDQRTRRACVLHYTYSNHYIWKCPPPKTRYYGTFQLIKTIFPEQNDPLFFKLSGISRTALGTYGIIPYFWIKEYVGYICPGNTPGNDRNIKPNW